MYPMFPSGYCSRILQRLSKKLYAYFRHTQQGKRSELYSYSTWGQEGDKWLIEAKRVPMWSNPGTSGEKVG